MKESARILTAIMVIIFGFAAIANTTKHKDTRIQVVPCDMGVFKMVYLKESRHGVQVGVLNKNDEVIMNDEISAEEGFIKEYDLNQSGTGTYVFRIQDSTGQFDQSVYYDMEDNLAICQMGATGKYKLVIDNPENISVSIFDEDHNLLESGKYNSNRQIVKVFDLSDKLDDHGEISFMIKKNNDFLKIATF